MAQLSHSLFLKYLILTKSSEKSNSGHYVWSLHKIRIIPWSDYVLPRAHLAFMCKAVERNTLGLVIDDAFRLSLSKMHFKWLTESIIKLLFPLLYLIPLIALLHVQIQIPYLFENQKCLARCFYSTHFSYYTSLILVLIFSPTFLVSMIATSFALSYPPHMFLEIPLIFTKNFQLVLYKV